jgi:Ni,Fe-hydrogenase I large subunit
MSALIPQNVLLISETKIKNFTDIDQNVSSAVLLPFISVVQQTKLEYIIGGKYYKKLLEGVINSNLSVNDQNFLEYFAQPLLLWAAYEECLPSVWGRIKNNGIVNGAEQSVTLKEMQWFVEKASERSQFFEQRMIEQIIWNSNLYPDVFNYSTQNGMKPHLGKNYFSGVELSLGRFSGYEIATGMKRAGIGYYSGPEYACLYGGC